MNSSEGFVAIFDSGLGGLTIMREIMDLLPYEHLLYFGDMARVPYGGRSQKAIVRYAKENVRFLMQKPLKCLVIACHTVSAYALQELSQEFSLPILGVIEPTVLEVVKNNQARHILILGTSATIASNIYPNLILKKRPEMKISSIAAPLFVPFVEEGLVNHLAAKLIVQEYLKELKEPIDLALLGCTHYPLMKAPIQKVLGSQVSLMDAGPLTAKATQQLLSSRGELAGPQKRKLSFFVTDHREKFCKLASLFLGHGIDPKDVQEVEIASL
jgi:glutamate racemase